MAMEVQLVVVGGAEHTQTHMYAKKETSVAHSAFERRWERASHTRGTCPVIMSPDNYSALIPLI
jgi:hypothetical protein